MDIFTPIVDRERLHPNFVKISYPHRSSEREIVSEWAEGFRDRDNKFIREFQTTFNSSFWEIYLHGLFKSYSFRLNWGQARPDFWLETPWGEVIVEAVTANAAVGATPEWEKTDPITENVQQKNFWPLNREAIIRLSNALVSKYKKYTGDYKDLPHVRGKPFILAVAPFEQLDFQYQYDRPIRALLYDDYVDETAFFKNPSNFPDGPPSVRLYTVEKDNGASIDLGFFLNEGFSEVSAVIFSCSATWGKVVAMSKRPCIGYVRASWSTAASGKPEIRVSKVGVPSEVISDGLQIFHNPYASHPLDLRTFQKRGVVQHYLSGGTWVREEYDNCLQFRSTDKLSFIESDE